MTGAVEGYPGERLGLPAEGPGAMAGWGRRLGALAIDWALANLIARLIGGEQVWAVPVTALDLLPLVAFGFMVWISTVALRGTIGQRLLGLSVSRLGGGSTGPLLGALRTGAIILVIPPLVVDADGRGLHDRIAGTVIRRLR